MEFLNNNFTKAFTTLLKVEGDYVNDPDDKGGATKYGITRALLTAYQQREASIDDVKSLSLIDAERIYFVTFWEPMKLSEVADPELAYMLFDQAVNRGQMAAVKTLQRAINKVEGFAEINVDGYLGPVTFNKINGLKPSTMKAFDLRIAFIEECQLAYVRIVENNLSQVKFLEGWINRTHKLNRLLWE